MFEAVNFFIYHGGLIIYYRSIMTATDAGACPVIIIWALKLTIQVVTYMESGTWAQTGLMLYTPYHLII